MLRNLKSVLEEALQERIVVYGNGPGFIQTESGAAYYLKGGGDPRAFQCEANGLHELEKADAIPVARVAAVGEDFILTEFIERGREKSDFFEDFGRRLARLHRYQAETFGFYEDNFIGDNPQPNIPEGDEKSDWTAFYFNKRLRYQYRLAERNGNVSSSLKNGFLKLENRIEAILADSEEPPALLHGDLWAGNFISGASGNAVLIDPAVYYGHREADLAMTKLFGGFPPAFYDAYQAEYPLKTGWQKRENIYKLYHVLNHLNLFGCSYLSEAERIVGSYTK